MIHEDFDTRIGEVVEDAVGRFIRKERKRPLSHDDYYVSVEINKRGRLQLWLWRDQIDDYRPALKFDFGKLLVEQLEYLSENDDWTFEPHRKALERLLRLIDATEKRCREKYESEQAGKTEPLLREKMLAWNSGHRCMEAALENIAPGDVLDVATAVIGGTCSTLIQKGYDYHTTNALLRSTALIAELWVFLHKKQEKKKRKK